MKNSYPDDEIKEAAHSMDEGGWVKVSVHWGGGRGS